MRSLAKYLFFFILVNCCIVIACLAFLHFADLNPHREYIAGMASKTTGRHVQINGQLEVNIFPHPEVIVNDVSLANAEWGSETAMISVKHVGVAINLFSLFSDTIIVRYVRLNDAGILLQKNDQQTGNWMLGRRVSVTDTEEKKLNHDPDNMIDLPVIVESAEFRNIAITIRAPECTDQVYHLASLSLHPDKPGNLILQSSGTLQDNQVTLNGRIIFKESLIAKGPVEIDIQASLGDSQLTGHLTTSHLATLASLQGTFSLAVKDTQNVLSQAGIKVPLVGPFIAEATVSYDGAVSRATFVSKVEGITTTINGSYAGKQLELSADLEPLSRVGELFDVQGLRAECLKLESRVIRSVANDFEIEKFQVNVGESQLFAQGNIRKDGEATISLALASPDLSTVIESLPAVDFNATASAHNSAEKITMSDLSVTFDKSDINGEISVIKGETQEVVAELTSKLLDLRPFSSVVAVNSPQTKKTKSGNHYVFRKEPLQLALLEGVETDVKFSANHFYYDLAELKDVMINASVHDGHLDAKFKCTSPNEGYAAGKIDLKILNKEVIVETLVSLSDFRMSALKSEGISSAEVPPMSVSIEIKSEGSSPRELAAAVNGRILFTLGSGKINNNMLKMFSNDIIMQLASALNPFAENEEFSQWDCTVININIVDGRAKIDDMLAQGENVMIVGGGDIDLKTEELHVKFNTKPRSGVGISAGMFVTPFIKVTGMLDSPCIGMNKKGTLLTGGAAIASGGLSLVLQRAFDRVTADGDRCEEALKIAGEHFRFTF